MYKELVWVYVIIVLILVAITEGKGGRGGGGGRSSGRSSSGRGGLFSGNSGSSSGSSFGGSHNSIHTSGGFFHGFFHSTPYHYNNRPSYISQTGASVSYVTDKEEEKTDLNEDTDDYAVGYSISRALSGDFFSIFNVVNDISKYPDKIKSKELLTTTTESPVATYNLNYEVKATPISSVKVDASYDNKMLGTRESEIEVDFIMNILKNMETAADNFRETHFGASTDSTTVN